MGAAPQTTGLRALDIVVAAALPHPYRADVKLAARGRELLLPLALAIGFTLCIAALGMAGWAAHAYFK
jgi:hypothetical protein